MIKFKKPSKRIVLIVVIAFVLLAATAFLLRGWIRSDVLRWAVTATYADDIGQHFEADFNPVNERLKGYQITFGPMDAYTEKKVVCADPYYESWNISYFCSRTQVNDPLPLSDELIVRWQKESPGFEKFLLASDWEKTWDAAQPVEEVFNYRDGATTSVGVNYLKEHGKITCRLSIWHTPSLSGKPELYNFMVSQGCSRSISFFGGY